MNGVSWVLFALAASALAGCGGHSVPEKILGTAEQRRTTDAPASVASSYAKTVAASDARQMTPDELQRTFTPTASAPLSRRSLEEAFTAIKNETDDAKMRGRIDDYLDIAAELPPAERQAATRRLADYFDHSRTQ